RVEHAADVCAEFLRDLQRGAAAAMLVGLEQSGHQLVPAVERHPAAVQVEGARADIAAAHLVEYQFAGFDDIAAAAGEAGDEPVRTLRLAQGQLIDDVDDTAS